MKSKMASKFAFKNMKANALLLTPFLIASSIMGTLFFVMASLGQNLYIEKNHEFVVILIKFGIFIVGIFTFIFILYANSFLAKRRNKEFALYGILGLEKRHIAKIISIEYILNFLTVSFFSITGGFVLGKLAFILLNRITKNMTAKIMDYNFSSSSAILTLIFLGHHHQCVGDEGVDDLPGLAERRREERQDADDAEGHRQEKQVGAETSPA